ncbi:MAG: hypothetical protein WCR46_09915 [Deltaproteobacteria bacterium]|jgi:hypothetical protein
MLRYDDSARNNNGDADPSDIIEVIKELVGPIVIFALRDRITGSSGTVRTVIVGLQQHEEGVWVMLRDMEKRYCT